MSRDAVQAAILALQLEDRLRVRDWLRAQVPLWCAELEAERQRACLHLRVEETEWGDWHIWKCKDCRLTRKTSRHRDGGGRHE